MVSPPGTSKSQKSRKTGKTRSEPEPELPDDELEDDEILDSESDVSTPRCHPEIKNYYRSFQQEEPDEEEDSQALVPGTSKKSKKKGKKRKGATVATQATYAFTKKHAPKLLTYDNDDSKALHELFCK